MTPMLRQYLSIKEAFPDAILFFRMGDFYEMFFEDAVKASRILGITLTARGTYKGRENTHVRHSLPCVQGLYRQAGG